MMLYLPEETELAIRTSASRMLLVGTAQIAAKTTRDSQEMCIRDRTITAENFL